MISLREGTAVLRISNRELRTDLISLSPALIQETGHGRRDQVLPFPAGCHE